MGVGKAAGCADTLSGVAAYIFPSIMHTFRTAALALAGFRVPYLYAGRACGGLMDAVYAVAAIHRTLAARSIPYMAGVRIAAVRTLMRF